MDDFKKLMTAGILYKLFAGNRSAAPDYPPGYRPRWFRRWLASLMVLALFAWWNYEGGLNALDVGLLDYWLDVFRSAPLLDNPLIFPDGSSSELFDWLWVLWLAGVVVFALVTFIGLLRITIGVVVFLFRLVF